MREDCSTQAESRTTTLCFNYSPLAVQHNRNIFSFSCLCHFPTSSTTRHKRVKAKHPSLSADGTSIYSLLTKICPHSYCLILMRLSKRAVQMFFEVSPPCDHECSPCQLLWLSEAMSPPPRGLTTHPVWTARAKNI